MSEHISSIILTFLQPDFFSFFLQCNLTLHFPKMKTALTNNFHFCVLIISSNEHFFKLLCEMPKTMSRH